MVVPKYESKVTVLLTQTENNFESKDSITQSDLSLNNNLIGTYSKIIKSDTVLNQVKDNLKLKISKDALYCPFLNKTSASPKLLSISL